MTAESIGLVWFRGGLRLQDNSCFHTALKENRQVFCCFILDDHYMRGPDIGAARACFLLETLALLDQSLQKLGAQLIVRRTADAVHEIAALAHEVGAARVYANQDYLPYPLRRDAQVQELLRSDGRQLCLHEDLLLVPPRLVLTAQETPYTVFTPFKRKWETLLQTPSRYQSEPLLHKLKTDKRFPSSSVPELSEYGMSLKQNIEPGGEERALQQLERFVSSGLPEYHLNRDQCALLHSTSRLSMHLKWGTLSIRDCYRAARRQGGPGADKWIDELAWREFFYSVTYHFPHTLQGPMLPEYKDFPWSDNQEHLQAWKTGNTGIPFVDAGMRQLNQTGWMHNRLRQVTASYLCKDLLIHWQEGERYFMQMLVDGDWPSNNGGWQWVSGSGVDPRRATRIFNPILQQERYDPDFAYVRQWVEEFGTARYPLHPLVTHEEGRRCYLDAFQRSAAGRQALREQHRETAAQSRQNRLFE